MSEKVKNTTKSIFSVLTNLDSYTKSTKESKVKYKFLSNQSPIPMNYKILSFILFFTICIGIYIFYLNPYNILNYLRVPIIIFYIFVFFCVLIFIERYTKDTNVIDKNSFSEMQIRFIDFMKSYVFYIAMLIIFSVVTYFMYKYLKTLGTMVISSSLPLTLGLVILILALFSNYSKNHTIDNPILDVIRDIIMYIPCLLTDTIDYLKRDYENTPSSVIIVFIILVVYCIVFYISPLVKKEVYKNDGILLIENPVYLNKSQINITTNELQEKIFNNLPFYDRWLQNMIFQIYTNDLTLVYNISDVSNTDISYTIVTPQKVNHYIVPPDKKTIKYYENFTSLMNQDTMPLTAAYNSLSQIEQKVLDIITSNDPAVSDYIKTIDDKPEQLKEYIKSVIKNEPNLLSFVQKVGILYSSSLAARDGILMSIYDNFKPMDREIRSYHYSISLWVFLHKIEKTQNKQIILNYGTLPSLYYNSNDSSLSLEYISDNKPKVLYKTKNILFQRWNHIVINYNYGTVDLFINNNLVGNYRNVSPLIYDDNLLIIGSKNNKNIGGIANVKYYTSPISASKIQSIYTQFNNKDPPI
jgi:Concanavalin A-like lectin/glucanases superfamily